MTTGIVSFLDPASAATTSGNPSGVNKPWAKVDASGASYKNVDLSRDIRNIRGHEAELGVDVSGFAFYHAPSSEKDFKDEAAIRTGYYAEVKRLLRDKLAPGIKDIILFDHTIRRNDGESARKPVNLVHVDQTPGAAAARARRHISDQAEVERVLNSGVRYQIINVWRAIGHPATDRPLALVDYRTTVPADLVATDLLYPIRPDGDDRDDHSAEEAGDREKAQDTTGYEVRGETFAVAPSDKHQFWYAKDATPDEAVLIKCFDSHAEIHGGKKGVAAYTPHTSFDDPETPAGTPPRQSIEVRALVVYDE